METEHIRALGDISSALLNLTLWPSVNNWFELPDPVENVGALWYVRQSYASLSAGWYRAGNGTWTSLGSYLPVAPVDSPLADTAILTSVASALVSVLLAAANPYRKGLTIYNQSSATLYLAFADVAATARFTVRIPRLGYYEMPTPVYTGPVSGVWDAQDGSAQITELS